MKYQNKLILIISMVLIFSIFSPYCKGSNNKKIQDVFGLNEKTEIIITEVYFKKQETAKLEEGIEIHVSKAYLKEMFLERAVTVSGEMINYVFGYEAAIVSGIIKNGDKSYKFDYNLAGFGTIFTSDKDFIQYGDLSKKIPEQ